MSLRLTSASSQKLSRSAAGFDYNSAYTRIVAFRPATVAANQTIIAHSNTINNYDRLWIDVTGSAGKLRFRSVMGGVSQGNSISSLTPLANTWYYLGVVRYSATSYEMFGGTTPGGIVSISPTGLPLTQTSIATRTAAALIELGGLAGSTEYADGRCRYDRLFASALSLLEIQQAVGSGLWGEWLLTSGTDFTDSSGNARPYTAQGTPTTEADDTVTWPQATNNRRAVVSWIEVQVPDPSPPAIPPVANFTFTISPVDGRTVTFRDTSTDDGSVVSRVWDFGDGGSSTATNPTHTYEFIGQYSVSLTVTDNATLEGAITQTIDLVPVPLVFARARELDIERLELWTDVEQNGGVALGIIAGYEGLNETKKLDGEHTIQFSVPLHHPIVLLPETPVDLPNLRIDQVVRLVMNDGTYTEHRISETARENKITRRRDITARSIRTDLGFRGTLSIRRVGGGRSTHFQGLGMTMREHIETYILPAGVEAGQDCWVLGDLAHSQPVDVVYEDDTRLSGLLKIAEAAGDKELYISQREDGYAINIIEKIGIEKPTLVVRAKVNLTELGFRESGDDQATRIFATGSAGNDRYVPNIGDAVWGQDMQIAPTGSLGWGIRLTDITQMFGSLAAPGSLPIAVSDQFLKEPGKGFYYLHYLSNNIKYPIVGTDATTGTFYLDPSTAQPPLNPSIERQRVRIVADGVGTRILSVEHPVYKAAYGIRDAHLQRPDIPSSDNYIQNPFGRIWSRLAPAPQSWLTGNGMILTREQDPQYWEHGGHAIRVVWPNGDSPTTANELISPTAHLDYTILGFLSFFARVRVLRGAGVRVSMTIIRKNVDRVGVPTPGLPFLEGSTGNYGYVFPDHTGSFANEDIIGDINSKLINEQEDVGFESAWDLTKYPLYAGTVYVAIWPVRNTTGLVEAIIEGVQVTNSPRQQPLIEGNGGARLHQAANNRLRIYAPPSPSISVNLVDLAMAEGLEFPYAGLEIGGPIQILDPDSDMDSVTTRIVGWTRDWKNKLMPNIEVSNQRQDFTRMVARVPRSNRQQVFLTPREISGKTFAP